jgi:hypothetical protein
VRARSDSDVASGRERGRDGEQESDGLEWMELECWELAPRSVGIHVQPHEALRMGKATETGIEREEEEQEAVEGIKCAP